MSQTDRGTGGVSTEGLLFVVRKERLTALLNTVQNGTQTNYTGTSVFIRFEALIFKYFNQFYTFFQRRNSPQWAKVSSLSRLHDHTQIHHTR
jgi:hypothetical protein